MPGRLSKIMNKPTHNQTYGTLAYKDQEQKEQLYESFQIAKWQRETEIAALADAQERGVDDGEEGQGFSMVCISVIPEDGTRVMALFNTRVSLEANVWSSEFLRICLCPTDKSVRDLTAEMSRVWNDKK
jgi:hypothetical protein